MVRKYINIDDAIIYALYYRESRAMYYNLSFTGGCRIIVIM